MKKNLFIPFIGLFILATCAFYYFNQAPSQKLEAKQVPPVLFEAKDFSTKFLHHGVSLV